MVPAETSRRRRSGIGVLWNSKGAGLADVVERYVKKGDRLYVEGRVEYRQWQDKDGQTKYMTEINVREMVMLGGRGGEGGGEGGAPRARAAAPERGRAGSTTATTANGGGDDFEDFPGALEDDRSG